MFCTYICTNSPCTEKVKVSQCGCLLNVFFFAEEFLSIKMISSVLLPRDYRSSSYLEKRHRQYSAPLNCRIYQRSPSMKFIVRPFLSHQLNEIQFLLQSLSPLMAYRISFVVRLISLIITVQAPHPPSLQPILVPVKCTETHQHWMARNVLCHGWRT